MAGETLLVKILIVVAVMALAGMSLAAGVTETLQQGMKGYSGCITRTIVAGRPAKIEEKGILPLRGSKHGFHVRFEMPANLAGKTLARARLELFLPAARKPNAFTELFCHEVTAEGETLKLDEQTDFDNGRRPGAVDSVELFAPPHEGWQHYPWLPLGVPKGGKWIAFNITPLAEKWLKNPSANRGVVIVPTDCPKEKFPSTWEIDIPSAAGRVPARRPRLTLELAPLKNDVLVGMTNGMVQILDRSTRFAYRGGYETSHKMSMAANELEGFQVVVYPMLADLKKVRFTWTDLKGAGGRKIPAEDVECFIEDWYKLRQTRDVDEIMFAGKRYEVPDPLLPAKPVTVRRHMHTPFYFRVRTRPETPAGSYRGTITLQAEKAKPTKLPLEVKVWPFAIPRKWNFHTVGQFIQGTCQKFHGADWGEKLRKKYYDFLIENRFAPTEQYSRILSPRQDLGGCLKRGVNTVYLSGNFNGTEDEMVQLSSAYEQVKKLGALDHALVYVGDETNKWDEMHRRADIVHARLPGAMVMIGGSVPRKELIGYVDIYDPIIGPSKTYGIEEKAADIVRQSQQRGEEFYWYVCVGPKYPYPNVMLEYPPVMGRVLFWMTWKYGVTGFEYYCYNIWHDWNFNADPAKRYPQVKWVADGWQKKTNISNGDGMLFYPGPISSLRFEAVRDGVEEWEAHQVLRDCVEAVRRRKHPSKYRALIAKAEKLLAVKDNIVASFRQYTTDPDELLAAREEVAELLGRFVPIVQDTEKWDAGAMRLHRAAEVRVAAQTALRRKMLRQRHLKACAATKVEPLAQAKWDALWPKRVLFSQDFEGPSRPEADWEGTIVSDNTPKGSKRALAGKTGNKYFARRIRVGMYYDNARAATTTWVKFKYFINKPLPVGVFVFDMTQSDNWAYTIDSPTVGKWTEVTLNVTELFRKKAGGRAKIRGGDAIDDVFVHAGKPGDKELRLLVDDVQLIGLD